MREKLYEYTKHPLISGSSMLIGGSLIANFLNFLFHLFMIHSLTLVDYGALASLVSLITLLTFASEAFIPTVVHFTASYLANNQNEMLKGLFNKATTVALCFGFSILFLTILFERQIGKFFNITDNLLIVLVGVIVVFSFLNAVTRAMLQARLSFLFIAEINIISAGLKLASAFVLIVLGFGIWAGVWAFLISFSIPYLITLIPLRFIFSYKNNSKSIKFNKLFSYGIPSGITVCFLTFFISSDVILVKHFFDPVTAGLYAGLSLIGKVIFFLSAPVGAVMFPLVVGKHAKKQTYHGVFLLALLLVALPSVLITIFYFLFPGFVIQFFLKHDYISILPYVGFFGVFISFYSLLYIVTIFFLSIKKTGIYIPICIVSILQIFFIFLYHKTFFQVIFISTCVVGLLLMSLLLYYGVIYEKERKER